METAIAVFNCIDLYHTSRAPVHINSLQKVVWSWSEGWSRLKGFITCLSP